MHGIVMVGQLDLMLLCLTTFIFSVRMEALGQLFHDLSGHGKNGQPKLLYRNVIWAVLFGKKDFSITCFGPMKVILRSGTM